MNIKKPRSPKHTISDIRAEFKKLGCFLITKEYRSSKQRLQYRCKCGKTKFTCWNNFSRWHNCKECSIESKFNSVPKNIILRDRIYSLTEVSRYLNVKYHDLRKHILQKTLPGPSVKLGSKLYFTEKDLKKIESLIE